MKIINVLLNNFASYKELSFDLENQGLTLIQGPTGSGKSTLMDAVPWVLFGKTAKGGAVDEVLSWSSTEPTQGSVRLQGPTGIVMIRRTRGAKANDLFIMTKLDEQVRGKDIPDTQRMINELLGLTYETYLAGAYFHEFSPSSQFFSATAKVRRAICEQMVDLSFPKMLQANLDVKRKQLKDAYTVAAKTAATKQTEVSLLDEQIRIEESAKESWQAKLEGKRHYLAVQLTNFDRVKQDKIDTIGDRITAKFSQLEPKKQKEEMNLAKEIKALGPQTCRHCNSLLASTKKGELTDQLHRIQNHNRKMFHLENEIAMLEDQLIAAGEEQNNYAEQLASLSGEQNPHILRLQGLLTKQTKSETALEEASELEQDTLQALDDTELLTNVISELRVALITNSVTSLEYRANDLLAKHFDAELRLQLETGAADKIDVTITKDGNECSYTQLSKGQRRILNLCFAVAVMEATANSNGNDFQQLFFDEALDGLDDNMKNKAFGLFETLALTHESVFVVEHSEALKTRFLKSYSVSLANGESTIEEA